MYRPTQSTYLFLVFVCSATFTFSALADELSWTGGETFFSDADNWNPNQSPDTDDNLIFSASATAFDLNLASQMGVARTSFLGGHYTMNGAPDSLLSSDGNRIDGTVTATGEDTKWAADGGLTVGETGAGTLNVEDDAVVSHLGLRLGAAPSGIGTVNVSNARLGTNTGGSVARVGVNGSGTLNVTDGGVSNTSSSLIGVSPGSTGTVNVTGAGSKYASHVSSIVVGDEGAGHVNLAAGGEVEVHVNQLIVGNRASGVGTIDVDNGTVNVAGDTSVGGGGTGSFSASNASLANTRQFVVGRHTGSQGTAVFDQSTLSASSHITVGWDGLGQAEVRNGSTVSTAAGVYVGWNNQGDNRLEVTGGSTLTFGAASEFHAGTFGTGDFLLNGGSTLTGGHLKIAESTLDGVKSIGNATFTGSGTVANLRSLVIGNSGVASANISGGARVNVNNDVDASVQQIFVGDQPGSEGTLTISGSDGSGNPSTLSSSDRIEIGGRTNSVGGTGIVNVTDGGRLVTNGGVIGRAVDASGVVSVSGAGSHWHSSGSQRLFIGYHGRGRMRVANGATATTTSLRVADIDTDAISSLVLDGAGSSLTVTGDTLIGRDGRAVVEVTNGATLTTHSNVSLGDRVGGHATVAIDDATWNHEGTRIRVGNHGGTNDDKVSLFALDGSTINTPELYLADSSSSSVGRLSVFESVVKTGTSIIGDEGFGVLVVADNSVFEANLLDIGGLSGSGVANVVQGGTVSVGSVLNVGRGAGSTGRISIGSPVAPATVSADTINIAAASTANGEIDVNSFGTLRSATTLTVGGQDGNPGGTGMLNLAGERGIVNVGTELVVTPTGTVNLSDGTLITNSLTRYAGSTFEFTGGQLDLRGDHVLNADRLADIFNDNAELMPSMNLLVYDHATLDAPLRLRGGAFAVGSINNLDNLDWETGLLQLGSDLTIGAGGLMGDQLTLTSGQNLTVFGNVTNNGLINATGNRLTFVNGMRNNGDLVLIDTTVSGPIVNSAGSTITVLGEANFTGSVTGDGNFSGTGTARFSGGFSPGDEVTVAAFAGDVSILHSLDIEIGGRADTQFDALDIAGAARLAGALNVDLIDLGSGVFVPEVGDSFTFFSADGGISGLFSEVNLPRLSNGLDWQYVAGANSLRLDVISQTTLQCDMDADGDCDQDDINALYASGNVSVADIHDWLNAASTTNNSANPLGATYVMGDANLDGKVDSTDLGLLLNNFGSTSTPVWMNGNLDDNSRVDSTDLGLLLNSFGFELDVASAVAVPEPIGLIHTLSGWLLVIVLRQQRQSNRMPCRQLSSNRSLNR